MRLKFKTTALAAVAVLVAGSFLGSTSVAIGDEGESLPAGTALVSAGGEQLVSADHILSTEELTAIGSTQSRAQIEATVALQSDSQDVQVLLDMNAPGDGVVAAVLSEPTFQALAVTSCFGGPSAQVRSYHNVSGRQSIFGYCGTGGTWTGSHAALTKIENNTHKGVLFGPSSLSWKTCATAVCSVTPQITLGYVSW